MNHLHDRAWYHCVYAIPHLFINELKEPISMVNFVKTFALKRILFGNCDPRRIEAQKRVNERSSMF